MSLETYHNKRDFSKTLEPKGNHNPAVVGRDYLIQKHQARHLHYDFRLQLGGVLKSWAVPKGPSLNPKDKRLAVETEDHPLDYGSFEGTIPPKSYGAGTVMLWDRGEWEPLSDPEQGLKKGKLAFELHGDRLQGRWALIKMRGGKNTGKEWLLVKEQDEWADASVDLTQEFADSVVTRRSMDAIARDQDSAATTTNKTAAADGRSKAGEARGPRSKAAKTRAAKTKAKTATEWTSSNRLRHPSFMRQDKPARDTVREKPEDEDSSAAQAERPKKSRPKGAPGWVAGVALSNPDKVLYDQAGFSKRDLAEYYEAIAGYMLPYVEKRPLTLVRCPQGHSRNCFFQKHLDDSFEPAVKTVSIEEKKGPANYAYVDSVQGLIGLVQLGTLEIHSWGSRVDAPDKPDMLVFDLDPDEGVTWADVKRAVVETRDFLAALGLRSFLRTSGGKGLHVVVPIMRRHHWDEAKGFCKAVARALSAAYPDRYLATASKAKRKNRIFIDYLRNGRGATSICCYSSRSRPGAPVSAPLAWDELETLESSRVYRVDNVLTRVEQLKQDPWEEFFELRQSITRKMRKHLGMD